MNSYRFIGQLKLCANKLPNGGDKASFCTEVRMWQEHVSGKRRWHYYLWDVLMFQAWLEENPAR